MTFSYQNTPLPHKCLQSFAVFFFMSKRIIRHVGWCHPDMTCHVIWHGPEDRIWQNVRLIFLTFSWNVGNVGPTCHFLGGSADMTQCWQFQLRWYNPKIHGQCNLSSPLSTRMEETLPSRCTSLQDPQLMQKLHDYHLSINLIDQLLMGSKRVDTIDGVCP